MRQYQLKIAQPALKMSYFTWGHTQCDRYCKLRYTNFIEMMVPCFSQEALTKCLFTFNMNETGWGTEAHWSILIDATPNDMAILDEICIVHTRPIQSGQPIHMKELEEYQKKFNITTDVRFYDYIPIEHNPYLLDRETFISLYNYIGNWIHADKYDYDHIGRNGWFGLFEILYNYAKFTESKKILDKIYELLDAVSNRLVTIEDDMRFETGITGCCYFLEQMNQDGFLDNTEVILEDIDAHIWYKYLSSKHTLSINELYGIGMYFQKKLETNPAEGIKNACKEIAFLIKEQIDNNKSLLNNETVEILPFLSQFGINVNELVYELEMNYSLDVRINVEYIYRNYMLYKATADKFYYVKVYEGLRYMSNQLMTQDDTLKLCELLNSKSLIQ